MSGVPVRSGGLVMTCPTELFPGAYVATPPASSRGGKRKMHIADEIPFGQEVGA